MPPQGLRKKENDGKTENNAGHLNFIVNFHK